MNKKELIMIDSEMTNLSKEINNIDLDIPKI